MLANSSALLIGNSFSAVISTDNPVDSGVNVAGDAGDCIGDCTDDIHATEPAGIMLNNITNVNSHAMILRGILRSNSACFNEFIGVLSLSI